MNHRKTVVAAAVIAFIGGIAIFGRLPNSFMTNYDKSEFQISFKTAPEASINETGDRLHAVLAALDGIAEIAIIPLPRSGPVIPARYATGWSM